MKITSVLRKNFLVCWLIVFSQPAFALSNLTIMADSSVSLAVSKLARDYARQKNIAVATSFINKDAQNTQINEGAEANILITPNKEWLDSLQEKGLIDIYSRIEFARGNMALIGNNNSQLNMNISASAETAPLIAAMQGEQALLLPSPDTIYNGRFAKDALRQVGWLDVLEPYTLYIKDNAQIRQMVSGDNYFTIVPESEAIARSDARIIGVFPDNKENILHYYAAVIAGEDMNCARDFLRYLGSKTAHNILSNTGLMASAPLAQK